MSIIYKPCLVTEGGLNMKEAYIYTYIYMYIYFYWHLSLSQKFFTEVPKNHLSTFQTKISLAQAKAARLLIGDLR